MLLLGMVAGISLVAQTGVRADGKKEFTSFLLSKGTPGYTTEFMKQKFLWRAADNGMVYFNDVQIPADDQLGERGQGIKIMLKTIDSGRYINCGNGFRFSARSL